MTQLGRSQALLCGWLVLGWPSSASISHAAEVTLVDVHHTDQHYTLRLEALIAAPRLAVFQVITDYDQLHRLHRRVRESRVLHRFDARTAEVYTLLRGCVAALFCRTIRRVERVVESPPDSLVATVVPEQSDLSAGEVRWDLEETQQGTLLRYESSMDPDFWVPAVLGDALLQTSIRRTTLQMIERVEVEAQAIDVGGGDPWQQH